MSDPDRPTPKGGQADVLEAERECISVDAGAGAGKTTTMRWRIEELLTAADAPPSDRVLVLTFANEAATSIRESITGAERLTVEQAYNVDVYTYHSFCSRLVSEYAYVLGLDPDFDVITDDRRFRVIQSLIDERDYRYVSRRQDDTEAVVREAVDYIREMRQEAVSHAAVDERLPSRSTVGDLERLVIDLEREAARLFTPDDLIDWDDFETLESATVDSLEEFRAALSRWRLVARNQSGEIWATVDSYLHFLELWTETIEALVGNDGATAFGFLPQALFQGETNTYWWTDLQQTPFGHLKSYVEALEEVHALQEIYRDYEAELESRGALDFDGLVNRANTLINDSHVGGEIRSRWDYVFCDEFQDTDDVQMDVVTGLCRGEGARLLAIGDVDQAIYGWRGANPEGLNELGDAFTDHDRIDINRNFRSEQEILELTNRCGAYDSKHLVSDECDSLTDDGEPRVERDEDDQARLAIVNGDWTELTTAEEVATTITQLLEDDGFDDVEGRSLGDIAVIVRTNGQAREVAAQLRNRQIPYRIDGTSESELRPGVQTILSYFRALVDPGADIHLRRVLVLVYRVSEADLAALESAPCESLGTAVAEYDEIDAPSLAEPDRVERARTDLEELRELTDRYSLPQFYDAFLERTRIAWYLQEEDRAQLDRIEKFFQGYESDDVLRRFSEDVVDSLARSLTGRDDDLAVGIGSRSEDEVNVMTVHQAKGLQFDTVLFPYLEDEEWVSLNSPPWASTGSATWNAHRYDSIVRSIKEADFTHALAESIYGEKQEEYWRTFHVGVTRAESLLVLFSRSPEDTEGHQKSVSYLRRRCAQVPGTRNSPERLLETAFPDVTTPWSPERPRMGLWRHVREAFTAVKERYPHTVVNLSEDVSQAADVTPGTLTYWEEYEDELDLDDAIDEIHDLGRRIFSDELTERDPTERGIQPVTLSFDESADLQVQHSHTSLETYTDCPRRHLLDHVLYGLDDPMPAEAPVGRSDAPNPRKVGDVFHAVAEEAFYRNETREEQWLALCDRIVRARDVESVRDEVEACIRRYFATDVPEWTPVAAELPFELADVPGVDGPVVGYIDSVRRIPGKGLAVLDYKTTREKRDLESSSQLLLYVRACEELFDEPVEWAGYVYVGEAGEPDGDVDLVHRSDIEDEWENVLELLRDADTPSWEPEPGAHCRDCPHRSLGCAPPEHAYDNEYLLDSSDR